MEASQDLATVGKGENSVGLRPGITPTFARIGLRRTGVSLATAEGLKLAEAHALARDAVHAQLSSSAILHHLRSRGLEALVAHSAASNRRQYLLRPDLGRRLDDSAIASLRRWARPPEQSGPARLALVVADGLSALAAERHALPVIDALLSCLPVSASGAWELAPVVVAEQARVALGDAVAEALSADAALVLLGERPGLSSPDSLGAYVTWKPHPGTTDAERNCISNVRVEGTPYSRAAEAIAWFLNEGRRIGRTGVDLRAPDGIGSLISEVPAERETKLMK